MDIVRVLEIISAIATILLLFVKVDEKGKTLISLRKFVFLVFIICSVVLILSALLDKADDDKIVDQDDYNLNDNNWSELKNDGLSEISSNEYANILEEHIVSFEGQKNGNNTGILKIDSIINNEHAIDIIKSLSFEIQSVNLINYSGEIYNDGQYNDYEYVPLISGVHRFEFSNVPNGTDFRLQLFNSGWEAIDSSIDLDNGEGLTESLKAGETYYIRVEQYREFGPYTLNVGPKKEIVDITDYTAISDSIQYTDQENDYLFVAERDGKYRFEFSNVPNGTDFRLQLFNSGWEAIDSSIDLDNGEGLTESLKAGETYYIRVEQYREFGPYTLNVGPKKEIVDITDYTAISDSIQYTDQENDYLFVAERDGTYKFEFSNILEGDNFRLEIFNSGWECETSKSYLDNETGLDGQLLRGETYYIRVIQQTGVSDYTLSIKYQGIQ